MRNQLAFLFLMLPFLSMAQEDSTEVFDYSKFGDAQGVKRYCNQKVLNQTPQRIISLGMERMGGFDIPDLPVSAKPIEVRMGKGKGSVDRWVARVAPGRILFEIDGVSEEIAREALRLGAAKLPIKTKVVKRIEGI